MRGALDIELTRRCNLRCDYCFVGWSRDWQSDLPLATALEVVAEGAGLFPILHLTGGEPFAYRGIFEVLEAGARHGYDELLINTNGTMLTPETIARLASFGPRLALTVSLDGPAAIHDAARGEGRFEQTSRALAALLAAGVRAHVTTVVTPAVLRELAPFLRALREAHPTLEGVTLFPVGVGPEGSQKPGSALAPLTPGELRELALVVALLHKTGYPIGVGAYPIINPLLRGFGYPEALLYQCTAGRGRACVHADGSVSSCHPVKDPIYGRWTPGLLRRLADFEAHARLRDRDFDGCRSCEHQETCGHCRAFVTAAGEPLFGNDTICHEVLPGRKDSEPRPRRFSLPLLPGST